jgi:hypothetical protein
MHQYIQSMNKVLNGFFVLFEDKVYTGFSYYSHVHHVYVPAQNIMKKFHDVWNRTVYLMHTARPL